MRNRLKQLEESFFQKPNPLRNGLDYIATNAFHFFLYHSGDTFQWNTYLGYPIAQSAMDLQIYQEILFKTRPAFIIQTGVLLGGSILFFAKQLDLIESPPETLVIGVDISLTEKARSIKHPRVRLLEGSSTDPDIVKRIGEMVPAHGGMVVLDSDHRRDHVINELGMYQRFVDKGNYLVVEDTNINGHPVKPFWGPGPFEAARDFLKANNDFVNDRDCWRHSKISFHTWLRRERGG